MVVLAQAALVVAVASEIAGHNHAAGAEIGHGAVDAANAEHEPVVAAGDESDFVGDGVVEGAVNDFEDGCDLKTARHTSHGRG